MAYYRKRGESWSFTVDIGRDAAGDRKQKTVSGFKTKKDAERACMELLTKVQSGHDVSLEKETLSAFLKEFMRSHVKQTVAPNTYERQLAIANNYILPDLGHLQLVKVTPMHIQKFYTSLLNRGLAASTIHNIGNLLSKTFRTALEWGYIQKNVIPLVKKPRVEKNQMKIWTMEEMQQFLAATQDSKYHIVYVLALATGMRKGEILGLTWNNVDMNAATVTVTQTLVYANNELYLKPPKTASSNRTINIPEFAVEALKKHKEIMPPNDHNLVVTGVYSELLYPSALDKHFGNDLKKSGVPVIRFHDMRHTHATMLLSLGVNAKVIQERLGHANVGVTLNTYSHVLPSMQKMVAATLDSAFSSPPK